MAQILSNQWILKRRPHWDRLAALLAQSDASGLGQLSRAELQEIALLYRQVAADLSVLRQNSTSRTYAQHVNHLLARAHHIIYSGRKTNLLTVFRFLRDEYHAIFQHQIGYVAAALLVSVAFGLLGAALTSARPEFMRHFVGPEMIATMERHEMWTDQQSHGQLYHLCRRHRLRAGNVFRSLHKRDDAGRYRRCLPPLRYVAGLVELCSSARRAGAAFDHHRRRGRISPGPRHALSRRASLEGVGGPRRH
jgi:hypothetical protein